MGEDIEGEQRSGENHFEENEDFGNLIRVPPSQELVISDNEHSET